MAGATAGTKGATSKSKGQQKSGKRGYVEITIGKAQIEAVMEAAKKSGLLGEKKGRLAARVSPALIRQAKKQTGIEADSDLIQFALANLALKDEFAKAFKESRGKVGKDLKLGF